MVKFEYRLLEFDIEWYPVMLSSEVTVNLVFTDTRLIKTFFQVLVDIEDPIRIVFLRDEKLIRLQYIDFTKTQLLDAKLGDFTSFFCKDRQQDIYLDVCEVNRCLMDIDDDEFMNWSLTTGNLDQLTISVLRGDQITKYYVPLISKYHGDEIDIDYSQFDLTKAVQVSSQELKSILKRTHDDVWFRMANNGHIEIYTRLRNKLMGKLLPRSDMETNDRQQAFKVGFEIRYFTWVRRCASLSNSVSILLKEDYPMVLTYRFLENSQIRVSISPSRMDILI